MKKKTQKKVVHHKEKKDMLTTESNLQVGDSVVRIGMEKKGIYEIVDLKRIYVYAKSKQTGKLCGLKLKEITKVTIETEPQESKTEEVVKS